MRSPSRRRSSHARRQASCMETSRLRPTAWRRAPVRRAPTPRRRRIAHLRKCGTCVHALAVPQARLPRTASTHVHGDIEAPADRLAARPRAPSAHPATQTDRTPAEVWDLCRCARRPAGVAPMHGVKPAAWRRRGPGRPLGGATPCAERPPRDAGGSHTCGSVGSVSMRSPSRRRGSHARRQASCMETSRPRPSPLGERPLPIEALPRDARKRCARRPAGAAPTHGPAAVRGSVGASPSRRALAEGVDQRRVLAMIPPGGQRGPVHSRFVAAEDVSGDARQARGACGAPARRVAGRLRRA